MHLWTTTTTTKNSVRSKFWMLNKCMCQFALVHVYDRGKGRKMSERDTEWLQYLSPHQLYFAAWHKVITLHGIKFYEWMEVKMEAIIMQQRATEWRAIVILAKRLFDKRYHDTLSLPLNRFSSGFGSHPIRHTCEINLCPMTTWNATIASGHVIMTKMITVPCRFRLWCCWQ